MWLALFLQVAWSYCYPNMELRREEQWAAQLQDSGIPTTVATR